MFEILQRVEGLRGSRVDLFEALGNLMKRVDGIDFDQNGTRDPQERDDSTPKPRTPIEVLEAAYPIARDFREAGKGKPWDRVKRYPPEIYGYPTDKSRGQSRGVRAWERITTVVLHTAAVRLHEDRWLGVPCHDAIADNGAIILCHYHNAYLHAAHALNRFSVSIEISGDRTIAPHQIGPARELLRYVVGDLRAHRPGPVLLGAHVNGHKSRKHDTDPAIWREVGEWGLDTLGLELGPVVGSGRPIPASWWSSKDRAPAQH